MTDILVRNLDDEVLRRLKRATKANGRSLEDEIREILTGASIRSLAETRRLSARWLKRLASSAHSDSVTLLREDRQAR